MMLEFYRELQSGNGPVFLKLTTCAGDDHRDRSRSCTAPSAPAAGASTRGAATTTARDAVEMHISEIGFCAAGTAPRASGSTSTARPQCPGLYAAGDMACVPHNYMLGAFIYGSICGRGMRPPTARALTHREIDSANVAGRAARICAPLAREDGLPPHPVRVQAAPPGERLPAAAEEHGASADRPAALRAGSARISRIVGARNPHELMRAMEAASSATAPRWRRAHRCTAPRAAGASITTASTTPRRTTRTGSATPCCSRTDGPDQLHRKRAVDPYIVPVAAAEMSAYHQLRIRTPAAAE